MGLTAAAALAYTVYSGERSAGMQKDAQAQALKQATAQADAADQANNAANKKKPNVAALLASNQAAGSAGSTMLTGPMGVAPSSLTLGKSSLLGGVERMASTPTAAPMTPGLRNDLLARWASLKTERSSWIPHWSEISTHILPRNFRAVATDRNKGDRRYNAIYDNSAGKGLRVLAAGLMSGATSPARPWFRLGVPDTDLARYHPVATWLSDVQTRMMGVLQKSNSYLMLHSVYQDLGAFGTSAAIMVEERNAVLHQHPVPVGEYCLAQDDLGAVDTIYRETQMTVAQMVQRFGLKNCSPAVQSLYDQGGGRDKWWTVIHAIEPRPDYDPSLRDAANMPWRSVYFELLGNTTTCLSEGGYRHFPGLAPRWEKMSGDIYGTSPAMMALGDVKQLQHEQLRKAQGIDYLVNPPKQVPLSMKGQEQNMLPGGISYYDHNSPNGVIRTAFDVRLDLNHLLLDIQDVRERIRSAFFEDLFLMLSSIDSVRMTATEVAVRQEEKLLMLGPVLLRLHRELLDPLIDLTFERMLVAGLIPPAPPELQGMPLDVEYISVLAQAQKAVQTNGIDRYTSALGSVAQIKPEVLDKFDADTWADVYADSLGIDPRLIVPADGVALIRHQRQQAAQAQQQAELAAQQANTAKALSQAQTSQPSALTGLMDMYTGYGSSGAVQ